MPDVNFDGDTETDTGPEGAQGDGQDDTPGPTPQGPSAADFDPGSATEIAQGQFEGDATAATTDPLTAMLQGPQARASTPDSSQPDSSQPDSSQSGTSGNDSGSSTQGSADNEATAEESETPAEGDGEGGDSQSGDGQSDNGEGDDRDARREAWLDTDQFAEKTGINAEDPDEAAEQVNQMKDKLAGTQELQNIIQERPGFQEMLQHMAQGKTAAEAAAALDGVQTKAPDPEQNPEEYAEWKAAQRQKEQQREQQLQKQQEQQTEIQRKRQRMEQEFENVVEHHDDIGAEALGTTLKRLTVTAPGARFRAEDLHTLAKGLKFDEKLEEAKEKARKEGREEALQEVRGDGTPQAEDGLPNLHSAGGGASENDESYDTNVDNDVAAIFTPQGDTVGFNHNRV